mmetsp:Transcript_4549/g.9369  ORF Transcript_4549/g.9369 Transcript_4549/m.9369 type:complete len:474 (+) Transcript_4549:181-1602(+)
MFVIRNTFLDLADDDACFNEPAASRRSSSVPRTWKPFPSAFDLCDASCEKAAQFGGVQDDASPQSGASTTASDDDSSQLGDREHSTIDQEASPREHSVSDQEASPTEEGMEAEVEEEKALTFMAPAPQFSPTEITTAESDAEPEDESEYESEDDSEAEAEAEAKAAAAAAEAAAIAAANATRWKHVVKTQLPSLPSRAGGSAIARLNALDLCFGKPFKKPKAPELVPKPKQSPPDEKTIPCVPEGLELRSLTVEKTRWSDEDEEDDEEVEPLSPRAVVSVPTTPTESKDQSGCQGKTPHQLSLSLHIPEEKLAAPTPLKVGARAFTPVSSLLGEVSSVVYAARYAMLQCSDVLNVEVTEGGIGGTTTLIVDMNEGTWKSLALLSTFEVAKSAILEAAENSSSTYVIGYLTDPFGDLGGEGFCCALGFVPAVCEATACWDTFQKGFCPRRSTCRWCHPGDGDLAQVRVMLRKYY